MRQHLAVMALGHGFISPLRSPARQHQGHLIIGLQRLQQALGARLIPLLVQLPGVGQQLATGEAAIQFLHVSRPARSWHLGQHGAGLGRLILPRQVEGCGVAQAVVLRPGRQPPPQQSLPAGSIPETGLGGGDPVGQPDIIRYQPQRLLALSQGLRGCIK